MRKTQILPQGTCQNSRWVATCVLLPLTNFEKDRKKNPGTMNDKRKQLEVVLIICAENAYYEVCLSLLECISSTLSLGPM